MSEHQWINFSARFTDVRFLVCLVLCVMNTNSLFAVLYELLVCLCTQNYKLVNVGSVVVFE